MTGRLARILGRFALDWGGFPPEVILCIVILHNGGFDQPVDASEEIYLKQMISRLTELGVGPGN